MTRGKVSADVLADRLAWVGRMIACIRQLPLADRHAFFADERNVFAAESCLRRALEALLDAGRHILAKGFAVAIAEYKQIARELARHEVLDEREADLLERMAGYRNRMVHFYHDVTADELYTLCTEHLSDLETLCEAYRRWARVNADRLDQAVG